MSENIKNEIPVKLNYDNNKKQNNHNWNNQNQNNNNAKKSMKHDYKLYFYITLWVLFITLIYFLTIQTPENIIKWVYEDNQKTYIKLKNLESIIKTWTWIIKK